MSLGVDLVPYKTCTMDCVYCESGKTTDLTVDRAEFFPTEDIIQELDSYMSTSPDVDFITFSGAGEPTLHSGIGRIIEFLKTQYPAYKICLLTNGMLLSDDKVFNEVLNVDLIVPSLDAADPETYARINRPAVDVDLSVLIDSYRRFHKESDALFHLEIFIIPGLNDSPEALKGFKSAISLIKPDRVQLNSLDRPGTEASTPKITRDAMLKVKEVLDDDIEIEIIGKFTGSGDGDNLSGDGVYENLEQKVLNLVSRRPSTADDIQTALRIPMDTVMKLLVRMKHKKIISIRESERGVFYL